MDENFNHELEIYDTLKNRLYTTIVERRERYTSMSRFVMQIVSFVFLMIFVAIWLLTRDVWYVWGIVIFILLTIANAQVLNYRVVLNQFGKDSEEDEDALDDLA